MKKALKLSMYFSLLKKTQAKIVIIIEWKEIERTRYVGYQKR